MMANYDLETLVFTLISLALLIGVMAAESSAIRQVGMMASNSHVWGGVV